MPQLLERDAQLSRIQTLFAGVARGVGACVLLASEAGGGKTALVTALADALVAHADVFVGYCDDLDTPKPLGPLADIARALDATFAALMQVGTGRADLFDALFGTLAGRPRPVLLVFEDVHWADESTRDLVRFLARRVASLPVMLVVTYRDDAWSQSDSLRLLLGNLLGPHIVRVTLAPLSVAAVEALARRARVVQTLPPPQIDTGGAAAALHRQTGGNAFFVTEMLQHATDGLPATVRDVILARLARLPPDGQRLGRIVSLVPGGCAKALLARAFGDEFRAAERALAGDVTLGLLVDDGDAIGFRHELARRAIAESVEAAMGNAARVWHRRFIDAFIADDATPSPLARLAHHARGTGDPATIVRWGLPAAIEAARFGANAEAAKLLADVLANDGDPERFEHIEILERHADAAAATSDLAAAITSRKKAIVLCAKHGLPLREGDNRRRLGHHHWLDGDRALALEANALAVRQLEPLGPSIELAWAYAYRASIHMTAEEDDVAIADAKRALALAASADAIEVRIHALNTLGDAEQYRTADWRRKLEESLRLALEHGYPDHAARAYVNLASTAVVACDFAYAREVIAVGIVYCAAHDCDHRLDYLRAWQSRERFESGDWSAAAALAGDLVTRERVTAVARIPALGTLAAVAVRGGAAEAASAIARAELEAERTGEHQRIAPLLALRAEAAWLARDASECARYARIGIDAAIAHGSHDNFGRFALWLWRAGECGEALAAVARFPGCPRRVADEVMGRWRAAAVAWGAIGNHYERAMALAAGGADDVRQALAILEGLGARPAVRLLRSRHSIRGAPAGPQVRTRTDPLGLTRRERQVLEYLAQGLSNAAIADRLFRSERTVEHHVSTLLAKLGVASRLEVVRFVAPRASP